MTSAVASPNSTAVRDDASDEREPDVPSADNLVELLGDEHTRRVLETIADEPMGGRAVAEAVSLSRPTVYRRLNDLADAGLVETTMAMCPDGHHHKQYTTVFETASLELTTDGLTATVNRTDSAVDATGGSKRAVGDD